MGKMGVYFDMVTKLVGNNPVLSPIWKRHMSDEVRDDKVRVDYDDIDPNLAIAQAVGLQGKCDKALTKIPAEFYHTFYTVMTKDPSNPFVLRHSNKPTVQARIDTVDAILAQGHPIVIAATEKGWKDIEGTEKQEVWDERLSTCSNLSGVVVELPPGLNGALMICGNPSEPGTAEAFAINFTQSHDPQYPISGKNTVAGPISHPVVAKRIDQFRGPLLKAGFPFPSLRAF